MLRFVWYGNFNFSSDLLVRAELSQIKWPSFPSRFHYFFFSLILFLFTGVCESRLLLWGFSDCANYWCFLRVQIEIISSCMLHVGASHLHLACLCHSAPFLSSTWLLACLWEFSVNDVGCWKLFLEFFWSERWKLTESQCRQQRVDKQENDVTNWNPFLRFSWDSAKHGCYYVRQRSGKIRVVFYEWQQKKKLFKENRISFPFVFSFTLEKLYLHKHCMRRGVKLRENHCSCMKLWSKHQNRSFLSFVKFFRSRFSFSLLACYKKLSAWRSRA